MATLVELQIPLFHHAFVHLYPTDIDRVYATCRTWKDTIDLDRKWLDRWCRHIEPHSFDDLPAVVEHGTQFWYKDGKVHRDGDLPAIIRANGSQIWYKDGVLHRDGDLPAEILADGSQFWLKDGKVHRDGDLPAAIYADGSHSWYIKGVLCKARTVSRVYLPRSLAFLKSIH